MSLEYTAAMDLVDTVIAVGTMAFWSVKALTVLWLQKYKTVLFYDRLQVSVEMQPSFCGVS